MTSVMIRLATSDDAEAIAAIYNDAVLTTTATFDLTPQTVEDRLRWLEAHDERHPVLVAELDGRVAGWASLSTWNTRPAYENTVESSFYVSAEHRGQGVGRMLKEKIIAEARRLGYHTLLALTANESEASIHLNKSVGFQYVGTMKQVGFKFSRWLDVHIFQMMLRDEPEDAASRTA